VIRCKGRALVWLEYSVSIASLSHIRAMVDPPPPRPWRPASTRGSGLLACLASLTQSRANSSNSDPDDMGVPPVKVPFVAFE
jgi:hypothetical protein